MTRCNASTRWWFQRFFIFTPIWGRFPFWLIFFKGVETTNQSSSWNIPYWCWFCCLVDILRIPLHQGLPFHPGSHVGKSLNVTILVGGHLVTFMIHCEPVFWQDPFQIQSFQVSRMLKEKNKLLCMGYFWVIIKNFYKGTSKLNARWLTTEHGASRLFLVIVCPENPGMVYFPTFTWFLWWV